MSDENGKNGDGDLIPPVPRHRKIGSPVVIVMGVAAVVLVSLAFGPVRSAASDFLRVLRIQEVQSLSLTAEEMQQISEGLSAGASNVDLASLGGIEIEGDANVQELSLADAAGLVDFEIRLPGGLESTPTILVKQAQTFHFRLDAAAVNELLGAYGSDRLLPTAIDGKEFTFESPTVVSAEYDAVVNGSKVSFSVMQARSPELVVPAGVDVDELRDILVSLPFIPPNVRDQLMAVDDWQNTFLVPVPGGESSERTIAGTKVVITSESVFMDPDSPETTPPGLDAFSSAVWNDGGIIRGIQGSLDESTLVSFAESMIR